MLHFGDLYARAHTKPVSLDALAPDNDATVLEGLRELTVRRNDAVGRECSKLEPGDLNFHAKCFDGYLGLLNQLLANTRILSALDAAGAKAGFLWSSPLSTLPSTAHFSLGHLWLEEAMSLYFYASLLQEQAFEVCAAMEAARRGGEGGEASDHGQAAGPGDEEGCIKAAALFRRAAGVYHRIRTVLLTHGEDGSIPADPPVELSPPAAELLKTVALAQAQGVAAYRAEAKALSPATLAAVHRGAADLFESAAATAKEAAGRRAISERLRRYLALSAELHTAKALRAMAAGCMAEGEAGKAAACLRDAVAKVRQCLAVADKDAEWREPLQAELAAAQAAGEACERERVMVHVQPVAAAAPPLPAGKVVVEEVRYSPPPCSAHFFL